MQNSILYKILIIPILICLVCLLGVLAYLKRDWLRQSAAPSYARTIYMPIIQSNFNKYILPINATLISYGFAFGEAGTNNVEGCTVGEYGGFGETIGCDKGKTSNKLRPSAQLTAAWRKQADSLEKQLFAAGWTKDNKQPIANLLDFSDPTDIEQHDDSYGITKNGVDCYFTLTNSPSSHEIFAVEGCNHTLNLFGG